MEAGTDAVKPLRLFYSYSHRDEEFRQTLETHLSFLRRGGLIAEWHDRMIGAGSDWKGDIDRNLTSADIVLLLVSADFIASDYCWSEEMTKALRRHEAGEGRVVPVILRPCRWLSTPLAKVQAVPRDGKAVTDWLNRDAAFDDVAAAIERMIHELWQDRRRAAEEAWRRAESERQQADAAAARAAEEQRRWQEQEDRQRRREEEDRQHRAAEERQRREREEAEARRKPEVTSDRPAASVYRDIDAPWCPEMVVIPAGSFMMGSPASEAGRSSDEGPQHRVTIAYTFAIGRFPVTFAEFDHFCTETNRGHPSDSGAGRGRRPVINVSWHDAQAYCAWLSKVTGRRYRLPSEAEWEYACRAGTTTRYAFGDDISPSDAAIAPGIFAELVRSFTSPKTTAVGRYRPNPWGVYDMHGNVWEWVEDVYHYSYLAAPTDGSAWTDTFEGTPRVLRGGSWINDRGSARSAYRARSDPNNRVSHFGFRVVCLSPSSRH